MQVSGISSNGTRAQEEIKRPSVITVKKGENLTIIGKRYGMSKAEFVKWTGLNGVIKVGQKITLPTVTVPKGKGIYALARQYNMTMAEFCKLNNISDPQTYNAKEGELFYVKTNAVKTAAKKKTQNKNAQSDSSIAAGAAIGASVGDVVKNQQKWGSSYSPAELGAKIFELSEKYYGAVGKPDFDALIKEINPKNAAAVITDYTANPKNKDKESLIKTIAREVRSDKSARKAAIMHIYDALAEDKGASNTKRSEFVKELDAQFGKLVGLVDTKNLDAMIQELVKMPSKSSPTQATSSASGSSVPASTKVVVPSSKYPNQTVNSLRQGAISSGKREALQKFKEYCKANNIEYDPSKLDLSPIERPPVPTVKGSSIVTTESELLQPTTKANGKVIIINAGHGGYSSRSGNFDPGSYSFIKKANGKYAPLLEYDKMRIYADSTVEKLRAQGYAVVLTSGHAQTFSDQKTFSNLVTNLNNGKKSGHKYKLDDIMLISLHADSEPGQKGSGVCYDSRFANDSRLASIMNSNLNEAPWVQSSLSERNWDKPGKGLQILHQTENIPSVLLEVEYVNGSRSQNLDSKAYQKQFEDKVVEAINEYYGFK